MAGIGAVRDRQEATGCHDVASTLYRHFPTREDLLAEVYHREVDELVTAAPHLLETHQPLDALAAWFDRVAAYARVERDVFAAVEDRTARRAHGRSVARGADTRVRTAGAVHRFQRLSR
ncbi:TetR/AcrR family transcriptional regulator [Nocardia jinanensis]|uniref:TetR family transcriptional regulator n=1 Tax=Nocardia jinanensis TaxID=382504 RepID=A0A917RWT5_9NOCA|nr:hypothetical protein [Nocardia jinanensis]GGL40712.1 hypothetical protein GCM10011588_64330 [Nocardia jinanensis]